MQFSVDGRFQEDGFASLIARNSPWSLAAERAADQVRVKVTDGELSVFPPCLKKKEKVSHECWIKVDYEMEIENYDLCRIIHFSSNKLFLIASKT